MSNKIAQNLGALLKKRGIEDKAFESPITTLPDAVIYAKNKIKTRRTRLKRSKHAKRVAKLGTRPVGAVAGAMVGTTIGGPVGTAAGALVGSEVGKRTANVGVNALGRIGRGLKYAFKSAMGTQGKHRNQAATVLFNAYLAGDDPLAREALTAIFEGREITSLLVECQSRGGEEDAIAMISEKLRSTTNDLLG